MKAAITMTAALMLIAAGCTEQKQKDNHDYASEMFKKLKDAGRVYTDSMAAAKDSAAIFRLDEAYEERLARITDEFPPETDNSLSETQNEILYKLTERYVSTRKKRLRRLYSRRDSVPAAYSKTAVSQGRLSSPAAK